MAEPATPRRKRTRTRSTTLTLRDTPDLFTASTPFMPWTAAIDEQLKLMGFKPGDPVCLTVNYDRRQIWITPDYSAPPA
ncbi:MAG: hypothetical protein GAK40_00682 [Burkholderia plantarii]|nr:MAG: hypothetical protein GAK40_00682 [Burkholderia plantarii]